MSEQARERERVEGACRWYYDDGGGEKSKITDKRKSKRGREFRLVGFRR